MKKCLVIGAAMLDIVMEIDELPKKGADVYASTQEMAVGGCAYNVADIMKHLDIPHTLFAPLGTGPYADIIAEKLKLTSHHTPIKSEQGDNGYCLCLVEGDGERTFITLPGVEVAFQKEWFLMLEESEYDSVYISGYEMENDEAIIEFLEKNSHLEVYYAPGPRITYITKEQQERIYKLNPVLHLNKDEALSVTDTLDISEAIRCIYKQTCNDVVVTLGDNGVILFDGEEMIEAPSIETVVVDTIGAGDSHIGTYISAIKSGKNKKEALEFANQVASIIVSNNGPTITKETLMRNLTKEE